MPRILVTTSKGRLPGEALTEERPSGFAQDLVLVWISRGSRGACGGGGGGGCGHGGGPAAAPQSPPRRDFREKGVSEAAAEGARRSPRRRTDACRAQ